MRLVRMDVIAGLPAADARSVLRLFRVPRLESSLASLSLVVDGRTSAAIAETFHDAGYLDADHVNRGRDLVGRYDGWERPSAGQLPAANLPPDRRQQPSRRS